VVTAKTQQELSRRLTNAISEQIQKDEIEVLPYPAVAMRLRKVMASDDFGLSDLEEVVKTDPALAATVLRHGNAAAFRGDTRATEVGQAISRIGSRELERVVLAAALGAKVCSDSALRVLRFNIWRDALLSAHFCQLLAKQREINTREAFLCGLLHDLGMVVAVGIMESIITEDADFSPMPASHWKELAQQYHGDLGLVLASRWELPEIFSEVITQHHELPSEPSAMVETIHAVDRLVALLNRTPHLSEKLLAPMLPDEQERKVVWERLGAVCSMVAALSQPPTAARSRNYCTSTLSKLEVGKAKEAGFKVTVQSTPPADYTAHRMDGDTIQIDGKKAQQDGQLLKITLDLDLERLEMWAKVTSSQASGDEHRVELAPFGMDDAAKRRWDRILGWLKVPVVERPAVVQRDLVSDMTGRLEGESSPRERDSMLSQTAALVARLDKMKANGRLDQEQTEALAALKKAYKACKARDDQKSSSPRSAPGKRAPSSRAASSPGARRTPAKAAAGSTRPKRRWVIIIGAVAIVLLVVRLIMLATDSGPPPGKGLGDLDSDDNVRLKIQGATIMAKAEGLKAMADTFPPADGKATFRFVWLEDGKEIKRQDVIVEDGGPGEALLEGSGLSKGVSYSVKVSVENVAGTSPVVETRKVTFSGK